MPPHNFDDDELLRLLQTDEAKAIEIIFKTYHSTLCISAYRLLKSKDAAKDVVQEVFMRFWKKRETIQINTSLKAYLRRAVVNTALNHIQKNRRHPTDNLDNLPQISSSKNSAQDDLQAAELKTDIQSAIATLPKKCRMVFTLSRYEQMTYKEIAASLEISVNTVENHISKALKILKGELKGYL
ncbi:MAG: RNA polymerase sigma factor [Chitinophagales bacterium]